MEFRDDESDYQRKAKRPKTAVLKPDYEKRPLWVCEDNTILLETCSEFYKQAYDFCIAIAEPESRLQQFHEYKITSASLYGAVSAGMDPKDIVKFLGLLSKTEIPDKVLRHIRSSTENVGKLKFYVKDGCSIIEASDPSVLRSISRDKEVRDAFINNRSPVCVEIDPKKVAEVRSRCLKINYPLLQEYDYKNDDSCPTLDIKLNPKAQLRPYQKRSVDKMFVNGKARSGVIVLPCGAGKSLTGIYAAVRLAKPVLCFANTSVSVAQWAGQFREWTNLSERRIQTVTRETKASEFNAKADIMVTTYSMYGYHGQRSKDSEAIMKAIVNRVWGLVLMDEVHVVPAKNFREAVGGTTSHCKLGLTATLLREDDCIEDLDFIIGPKLYEANWQDLVDAGYLATVTCFEIVCPMTKEFLREYLNKFMHGGRDEKDRSIQHSLCSLNPNKLIACEYLINYHEQNNDKIIVFSDNLVALDIMGKKLKRHIIRGETSYDERMNVLQKFSESKTGFTLFLSKVGDTSIDLPEANVVIQISSQGASRRQEAQRLGRVLRPKNRTESGMRTGGHAIFYSLVSQDTLEMLYATKRQKFLVNQGYTFLSKSDVPPPEERKKMVFANPEEQAKLLQHALHSKVEELEEAPRKKVQKKSHKDAHFLFKRRYAQ